MHALNDWLRSPARWRISQGIPIQTVHSAAQERRLFYNLLRAYMCQTDFILVIMDACAGCISCLEWLEKPKLTKPRSRAESTMDSAVLFPSQNCVCTWGKTKRLRFFLLPCPVFTLNQLISLMRADGISREDCCRTLKIQMMIIPVY